MARMRGLVAPLLLFVQQTRANAPTAPNLLRAARLVPTAGGLSVEVDASLTLETAPTPDAPDDLGDAPALAVAAVGGAERIFVGGKDTITVVDPATWTIVDMGGLGSAPRAGPGHAALRPEHQGLRREPGRRAPVRAAGDLHGGKPVIDATVSGGNGVDLNWTWLEQLIAATGETALPPMFPSYRRQLAASASSLFLIGFDNDGGAGSALANAADVATFDLATGKGHLWRGWEYEGISNAAGLWGYDLGWSGGADDANLKGARAKNAAVIFVP